MWEMLRNADLLDAANRFGSHGSGTMWIKKDMGVEV
jgi:hypothetical protein